MALTLNGTTQYIKSTTALLAGGYPYTMFCWFKPTNAGVDAFLIANYKAATEAAGIRMRCAGTLSSVIRITTGDGTTQSAVSTSTSYTANTWARATFVGTSATSRNAYLNNGGIASDAVNITPSGLDTTYIGANRTGAADVSFFPGNIAHVAVWSIALGTTDRTALEAGMSPWFVSRSNLICYLPLWDADSGLVDLTKTFTFTGVGTPTYTSDDPGIIIPQYQTMRGVR